jgi:hypothetical protein
VNVCVALRSADGATVGSGPTRHSAIATVASFAIVASIRIAMVVRGANSTDVNTFGSVPYGPFATTGFHSPLS